MGSVYLCSGALRLSMFSKLPSSLELLQALAISCFIFRSCLSLVWDKRGCDFSCSFKSCHRLTSEPLTCHLSLAASRLCCQTPPTWCYRRGSLGLISALPLISLTVSKGFCWFGLWCSHLLYFSKKSLCSVPPAARPYLEELVVGNHRASLPLCHCFLLMSAGEWVRTEWLEQSRLLAPSDVSSLY